MKNYIGCKVIKAEEMDEGMFLRIYRGKIIDDMQNPGYHVRYPDGYDSWSPKEVFEKAYRCISKEETDLLKSDEE